MRFLFALTTCFLLFHTAAAQFSDSLAQREAFFAQQLIPYQQWLDSKGLGQVLEVHETSVDNDTLSVYLRFRYLDSDSASVAWDLLQQKYFAAHGDSVERALFFAMLHTMQVSPKQANVQIYDTYDLDKTPCLFVGMRWYYGRFEITESMCRSQSGKAKVFLEDLPTSEKVLFEKGDQGSLSLRKRRQRIFDKVETFTRGYFGKPEDFRVLSSSNAEKLKIEIQDIRGYVLEQEGNSYFCYFWNWLMGEGCDHRARERIELSFTFKETDKSFTLEGELTGFYGSGAVSELKKDGYRSMEPEFTTYFETFTQAFFRDMENYFKEN